ncbi:ATP-binding cassette domain-containing protein [Vibrio vulnificus]|uniref:ATP-binding cassette domain-containing protein n=1 Tax=Vibrio vulnificus TaxID=672 RepID=UPI0002EB011A|nr:ATP-binding cassette domain-containing protein [Vibrio vulnificus]ASM95184.1 ABC transporter ATP-binding protein [Vibrio vulnificus NBRC 15645 = ATCC 27562]EGQ8001511.1 ATP-binding cassette domain-containing protein [Vibrio vulnificus]EGQ9283350.1 ATP-binding cassette domain-containing protein [Vibrio vulnificus]EGR0752450.1 ATP-binding cassette domain-containing protein [Vibrio vulnificus]EIO3908410.1 ATP-binding cassette domain-containing protein [Vibrio vulnificus]
MTFCLENLAIHKRSGETLFSDINLTIDAGEIVSLMGPSGCGKSTLLSLIAGHLSDEFKYSGTLSLNQRDLAPLAPHQRQVGILFQDDMLFPHLNIWQNLAFALPNDIKGTERKTQAINALDKIALSELADSYPEQISGGQRARVSLIRMLLAKPQMALLDEPFSKLDKELRVQFRDWVISQLQQANIPALMVTHDIDDVPPGSRVLHWPWEQCNVR